MSELKFCAKEHVIPEIFCNIALTGDTTRNSYKRQLQSLYILTASMHGFK